MWQIIDVQQKNNGPNIEACGTPHFIKRSDENEFFI
jgi:hypothetical protein